jgi:hypothetical protein
MPLLDVSQLFVGPCLDIHQLAEDFLIKAKEILKIDKDLMPIFFGVRIPFVFLVAVPELMDDKKALERFIKVLAEKENLTGGIFISEGWLKDASLDDASTQLFLNGTLELEHLASKKECLLVDIFTKDGFAEQRIIEIKRGKDGYVNEYLPVDTKGEGPGYSRFNPWKKAGGFPRS